MGFGAANIQSQKERLMKMVGEGMLPLYNYLSTKLEFTKAQRGKYQY